MPGDSRGSHRWEFITASEITTWTPCARACSWAGIRMGQPPPLPHHRAQRQRTALLDFPHLHVWPTPQHHAAAAAATDWALSRTVKALHWLPRGRWRGGQPRTRRPLAVGVSEADRGRLTPGVPAGPNAASSAAAGDPPPPPPPPHALRRQAQYGVISRPPHRLGVSPPPPPLAGTPPARAHHTRFASSLLVAVIVSVKPARHPQKERGGYDAKSSASPVQLHRPPPQTTASLSPSYGARAHPVKRHTL